MTTAPKTKAEDLFDRIIAFANNGEEMDEFHLAAFRREAKESLKMDAYLGYMALGALASLSWNDSELDKNHGCAIKLGETYLSHQNYAESLGAVLRYPEATKEIQIAADMVPADIDMLRRAIEFSVLAGQIGGAVQLHQKLTNRTMGAEPDFSANDIARVFELTGINEDEFAKGQFVVFDTFRHHRLTPKTMNAYVDVDDEPSVLFEYVLRASAADAQSIHNEICTRLCNELPDGGHPAVLMFSIVGDRS